MREDQRETIAKYAKPIERLTARALVYVPPLFLLAALVCLPAAIWSGDSPPAWFGSGTTSANRCPWTRSPRSRETRSAVFTSAPE